MERIKKIIHYFIKLGLRADAFFFYDRITVRGLEYLEGDSPVILVSNHPNSFLDGLILTMLYSRSIYYPARSDVFNLRFFSPLLYFINILPFYRKEEGLANVEKNRDSLSKCSEILKNKGAILIFPEGSSENQRKLRPFKKGAARLAFDVLQAKEGGAALKIIPVVIGYSSWYKIKPSLYIEFMRPPDIYSLLNLKEALFLKQFNILLWDIMNKKCLPALIDAEKDNLEVLAGFLLRNYKDGDIKVQQLGKKYVEGDDAIRKKMHLLAGLLKKNSIEFFNEKSVTILKFLWAWITYMIAVLFNFVPFYFCKSIADRLLPDKEFYDSILFCSLLFIYPVYIAALLIAGWFTGNVYVGLAVVLITLLSAMEYETAKRTIRCFYKKEINKNIAAMTKELFV